MIYVGLDDRFDMEQLGYIPGFLSDMDKRSAKEQLDANYQHGGGWRKSPDWVFDPATLKARGHPDDPWMYPFALTSLREEIIYFYPYSYVMVLQPDGSYECARMN